MPPIAETVAHGGVRLLWETSAVLACAPSRSLLCCRSCVLAPLGAPLARCCLPFYPFVAFGAPCSARLIICPDPPFAAIYMRPKGRAPPLFCISRTPDTQHLVVVGGTRRACGCTCLRARNTRRIWRFTAVGRHRGWVLYISVARTPTVAPHTPHRGLFVAACAARGCAP